ncbi:Helix-turn-helix domain-containing protein [Limimonas halophila]|uniref:Helix-turn-helix domain-containing protein n=1 Tax=Limimonas halophila TaxID=1082479 RepID=A0A1G7U2Q4_9PROT|nr:helix-turn-helix transcriptional regulator [Limimonas halophila]SDG41717.1 Helix-turn-helix domain-containing protein [Limimonas halophila]
MPEDTVTLSRDAYDSLVERLEEAEDTAALLQARQEDDGTRIPHAVVMAEIDGAHPVAAWRHHRGLGARELAGRAGLSPGYLSEIESGKKAGSLDAYRALARALNVPLDLVLPDVD